MATQLVPLQEIERLSTNVIRILGGNPGKFTLQGTNTYLVGQGPRRLLVDTGEGRPAWIQSLQRVLASEQTTVTSCILTHWHHDHVGGVRDLLKACPDSRIYKNQPKEGQLDIADGQHFRVDGATLRAVHTPGHTVDHMALMIEEENAMFMGDNVLGHGTAVFEDLAVYLASLDRMQSLCSGRAYPGHGAVVEDGRGKIAEYIKHRQDREEQIIQVLKSAKSTGDAASARIGGELDSWTAREVVQVIYQDVPKNLHEPAERGLLLVLHKLEKGDKVLHDSHTDTWQINTRPAL
ncbi:MAG: hypothetical protein M1827_000063 [Pycnora praestabilis]|nr:MAG: hypothetical protein M1827_000063 [Pycnora praestabilis]